jgi:hypothetical protein
MSQPNPEQQQQAQMAQQVQMAMAQADMQLKQAQAQKAGAEAQKAMVQAQLEPQLAQAKMISALSNNLDEDQEAADFERRVRLADIMLKEKDIDSNMEITRMQMAAKGNEVQ